MEDPKVPTMEDGYKILVSATFEIQLGRNL